ncbi:hypothetical protein EV700_2279 [Fluviicoccus keumensis]|uniref:Outer membrane protein beta-barrel domain-containing protein n=2 Tax=Fluviicoccus keumensis TaxID=1435465 RepID=A0A4Q7YM13_9GAMM|nr:hypothetical protein EV700_2279 [Fluviicoccus keumensis]
MKAVARHLAMIAIWLSAATVAQAEMDTDVVATPTQATAPRPATTAGMAADSYLGLFTGPGGSFETTVSATSQCFFCVPISASHPVQFEGGNMAGVRGGFWKRGDRLQPGMSMEFLHGSHTSSNADVSYDVFTVSPMLRLTPFSSLAQHGVTLGLYAGVSLCLVAGGSASVTFPEFSRSVSGRVKGNGTAVMAGISVDYRRLSLQLEKRSLSLDLDFEDLGDNGSLEVSTGQTAVGIALKF